MLCKKHILVWLIFLAGFVIGLSGCLRPAENHRIILRFASAEPSLEQMQLSRNIITAFEKKYPDIHVECEFGTSNQKILVQIAGGVGPDVFMWPWDLQPLIEKRALANLVPLADEINFDWTVFYPYMVDGYRRGNAIYALPIQLKTYCIVYNKDIFDRAHEPCPNSSWSWEKYLDVATRLTKKPERGPAVQFGNGPLANLLQYLTVATGGNWLNKTNGKFNPDTPRNRRALKLTMQLLRSSSPRPEDNESFGGASMSQAFLTGKIAMQIAPTWMIAIFNDGNINWDVAPVPSSGESTGVFDDAGLGINAKTAHPKEAFLLLSFYSSREAMELLASCRNGLSPRKDANTPFLDKFHPGLINYLNAAASARTSIKLSDPHGDAQYYENIIGEEFDNLYLLQKTTPDEFFQALGKRLNAKKPDIE